MADLDGRSRGQIILIAAFALAVIFITLALIVNSAIFTQNLASRGETSGADDALSHRAMVEESVGDSVEIANRRNASGNVALIKNVTSSVDNISKQGERQQVTSGKLSVLIYESETNGTRIYNESSGSNSFGSGDYILVENVERVPDANGTRAFRINATSIGMASPSSSFQVRAINSDPNNNDTYQMRVVNKSGGDIRIHTTRNDTDSSEDCVIESSPPHHIDVTTGTVDGQPCDALGTNESGTNFHFGTGATDEYDIYFDNADEISGNFSMVINSTATTDVLPAGPSSIVSKPALYDVTVNYTYETSGLYYNTTIRVAPGEPDA